MQWRRISPAFRQRLALFCGLCVLVFSTIPRTCAAEEEETDFEFDDNLVVKRDGDNATVGVPPSSLGGGNRTGDEALVLMDEPGSGPDEEDEMSGSSPVPTSPKVPARATTTVRIPARATTTPRTTTEMTITGETELFRSTINFTSVAYNVALGNRASSEFLQLAFQVQHVVEKEYENVPGKQSATVLQFRPGSLDPEAEPSVIATIDFATSGFYNDLVLFNVLHSAVNRGTLGSMNVSKHGFSFRPVIGNGFACPTTIGREPTSLPRREDTKANLMLNNRFICDGFLAEVAYFRGSPDGSFYIGVWKQDSENSFILRHRIEVPPAPIGIHHMTLPEPLPVERGDFLGIHYPRATDEGVIVHSIREDGVIPAQEMFQTLVIDVFDEDLPADRTINFEGFQRQLESKTFALLGILSLDGLPGRTTTLLPIVCLDTEFRCGDGTSCLHITQRCDGRSDCDDASDEVNCPISHCHSDEFQCDSGQCIEVFKRCDRLEDCDDGSDEAVCACKVGQFHCKNGWCIEYQHVCDGRDDCGDRSDEQNCTASPTPPGCARDQFTCGDGHCIGRDRVCNRVYDCPDGADEYDCPPPECLANREFRCTDGTCIDARLLCDEHYDCPDESDELDCPAATDPPHSACDPRTEFRCTDGACIDISGYCDHTKYDCEDGSDETNCGPSPPRPCGSHEFRCNDDSCIASDLTCNRQYDCPDGSDESRSLCEVTRPPGRLCDPETEFECGDGKCVDISGRCDRTKYDCDDGTDEYDCDSTSSPPPRDCDSSQFACRDGSCISNHLICDRRRDCSDGSDELDCPGRTPQPTCDPRTEFTCGDGKCVDNSGRCDRTKYDCDDGTDEYNCYDITPTPPRYCEPNQEFTCTDGTCVDIELKCDGHFDCHDGSDERECAPTRGPPQPACDPGTEWTCGDGTCVDISGRCDRTKYDCADGTDEFECDPSTRAPPTRPSVCDPTTEWTCGDGTCVDKSGRCDRTKYDCVDGTDEYDCVDETPEPPKSSCDPRTEFTCKDGTCVDMSGRCDRTKYDCADGTDEFECDEKTPPPSRGCSHFNEFRCSDGTCIDLERQCDGTFDCRDGSDEDDCGTPTRPSPPACDSQTEFTCGDGTCVDISGRCDRTKYDCADGTDEFECVDPTPTQCEPYQEFTCRDGTCIDIASQCDGHLDCPDRSDEQGCAPTRGPPQPTCDPRTEWTCGDGTCVDISGRCDRTKYDCDDGTDEYECYDITPTPPRYCEPNQEFTCTDGTCVDIELKCDGHFDCRDGSDEHECATLEPPRPACNPRTEFTCGDGTCVDISGRCDRTKYDCEDGTDEYDCPDYTRAPPRWCEAYQEFTCTDGSCINIEQKCDGHFDCPDGADEHGCAPTRGPPQPACDPRTEWTCGDGTCVDFSGRCDRTKYDCADGTDELDCGEVTDAPPRCGSSQFTCRDRSCVYLDQKCDGRYDCPDRSDEENCAAEVTVDASPSQLRQRVGMEAVFTCSVFGSSHLRPQWFRRDGDMPRHARLESGRLIISPLVVEDTGEYYCTVVGVDGVRPAVVRLVVDDVFGPTTSRPVVPGRCGSDEAACGNGACVPRDYFCDGDYDCTDRSDEENCVGQTSCEPNEFLCGNGKCILKIWRCDGDNDCADSTDERNCPVAQPGAPCDAKEFSCTTVHQCIPAAYQCDGEVDCQDRSDEKGCVPPTVTKPPPREVTAGLGETITIDCEAIGVPPPLIIWRLNWGHTAAAPRVTSRTDMVHDRQRGVTVSRGVITITDARKEDEGAYTCEALNSKGSILAEPDTIVHVILPRGVCQVPYFNSAAHSNSDCVKCFCFGVTEDCTSSSLYLSQFATSRQLSLVDLRSRTKLETNGDVIDFDSARQLSVIRDYARAMTGTGYYWSLPTGFLGNKVTSYGGKLSYTIYYETRRPLRVLEPGPDVFLYGNDLSLYHTEFFRPFSGIEQSPEILLRESAWTLDEEGRRPAARSDLMMALEHLEYILIKSNYERNQGEVRLGTISMTTAVPEDTRMGQAVLVEQCRCPPGYTGTSCERCLHGFFRQKTGSYLGRCVPCDCNGQSDDCDSETGVCRGCRDNSHGDRCDQCLPGFYISDDRRGSPVRCERCPCPTVDDSGSVARCTVSRGDVTCVSCPLGYAGKLCRECAEGYERNPHIPNDQCRPVVGVSCDPRGSTGSPSWSGQCNCKRLTTGQQCNECREGSFHLSETLIDGCLPCFCMGVTQHCTSTTRRRSQVRLPAFSQEPHGLVLTDSSRRPQHTEGLLADPRTQEVSIPHIEDLSLYEVYWQLPARFLGNKITSYGGYIRYNASSMVSSRYDVPPYTSYPDVIIGGNGFDLLHTRPQHAQEPAQVQFSEQYWRHQRGGRPTSRDDLMGTLSNLEYILIKAQYIDGADEAGIRDIGLDTAELRTTGASERAYEVEECVCPIGYTGLSCESCDSGYWRSVTVPPHIRCEPCDCHGHSGSCDSVTGRCTNCQHNTEGDQCDVCVIGYYGDATRGSPTDCLPCPCPLTHSPNQFSPTCILDDDDLVTCTACPTGHTGRRCESCLPDYAGNPLEPGNFCARIPRPNDIDCECDERGSVPNTHCDQASQCQCKAHVHGLDCSECRSGYFHLSATNPQGCLSCYCMGLTRQCTSSSYYRDEIEPDYSSSHGFRLTTRRLGEQTTDGITAGAFTKQIEYDDLPQIQKERESLFWNLPAKFTGNQVASYGGRLKFQLVYDLSLDEGAMYLDADVELISGDNRFYLFLQPPPVPEEINSYDILLTEASFRQLDAANSSPTRDSFLKTLASLDAILIRATHYSHMSSVALGYLTMETAVATTPWFWSRRDLAPEVEQCTCPPGYTGLSCEQCAAGFSRVPDPALPLGRCTKCSCNNHASDCDLSTGACLDCQHHTAGDRCERCESGFYGDPTAGTSGDCQPCPCPLTTRENQFSPTCFLDADGLPTCDQCPTGYTGRQCDRCAPTYVGNPSVPGESCVKQSEGEKPRLTVSPKRLSTAVGGEAVFQCNVEGSSSATRVQWMRADGRQLSVRAFISEDHTLSLRKVESTDEGRYICIATNRYGKSQEEVGLTVSAERRLQVIVHQPKEQTIRAGVTVRFNCTGYSQYTYTLAWSRQDGQVLPTRVVDNGQGILTIRDAEAADSGAYMCTGSNAFNIATDVAILEVIVQESAPVVSIEPRFMRAVTGESVEFRCIASGHPVPQIQWMAGPGRRIPFDAVMENNILRFHSVSSAQHAGDYYCTAYNVLGSDRAAATLEVHHETTMPPFEVVLSEEEVHIAPGDEATISCSARGNQAHVRHINWTRESGPLPPGSYQENGRLIIPVCRPSDSGTYVCTIYLVNGERQVAYSTLVIREDEIDGRPPQARTDPDRQTVQQGTRASIRCLVTGAPESAVRWSRTRGRLGPNHKVEGNVLTIEDVRPDDRGLYVCEVENRFGRTTASAVLEVERQEVPVVEIYPSGEGTTADVGSSVLFQCHATQGVPAPTISWQRADGQPLSHTIKIQGNGILEFVEVTGEEQGEYICTGSNSAGSSQARTSLHIRGSSPKVSLVPGTQTLRPGDMLRLSCSVRGAPQPRIAWSKIQGQLSPFATITRGTLEILSVAANDAGQYRCQVTDSDGRISDAFAEVIIRVPPGAFIMPRSMSAYSGQSVNFSCDVTGSPPPRIQWMKEGGSLPTRHRAQAGKLLLFNVQPRDAGRYICVVTNEVGTTRDYAQLFVGPGENGNGGQTVRDKQQVVQLGHRVEIACEVFGDENTRVTWVRTDGPLQETAVVRNTLLILPVVEHTDQGTYRCLASNQEATVYAQVTIIVEGPPTVSLLKQSKTISIGSNVTIACRASGSPLPAISWTKKEGRLPRGHVIRNNTLYLISMRSEDFGDYVCSARNRFGVEDGVMTLLPSELVPYFAQRPLSYLVYPGIRDAYTNIDFEISFKPERGDGLILYNGQTRGRGDFVLFGLRDRTAEFRFDAGGEKPVIIASEPLILNTWHTARAKKHGKDALLVVDGKEYRAQIVGRFVGLDLAQDLYLGGVPDFRTVSKAAKFDTNFVGCVSRLIIGGVQTQIGDDAIEKVGVVDCPSCRNGLCRYGGSCRSAATKTGFQCQCAEGYSGQHCELVGTKCRPDTCGSYGRCYNLPDDQGFKCICPVNKSGPRCEQGLSIGVPGFNGTSYIAYPTLEDALRETQIELTFNPSSLDDAVLLYNAFNELGDNDFVALIIREEHVEFRYNLGSGPAIIKSSETLTSGQWTTVVAEINQQEGSLTLNSGRPVKGQSLGTTIGLNLKTLLYVGGVDLMNIRLAPDVAVDAGFRGCISQLKVKGREVDMLMDAIESAAVSNCTETRRAGACGSLAPCQNGATCQDLGDTFLCICPPGFAGDTCDNSLRMTSAQFTAASSYVELAPRLLVHSGVTEEVIRMTVTTTSADGILLWQDQVPPTSSRGGRRDFIALALENGYLVFSYELGSGPAKIVSGYEVHDGLPHDIVAKRSGKTGSLTVDNYPEVRGESGGRMTGLEAKGVIYLGGAPDIRTKTRGKWDNKFSGCISNVFFQSSGPLDFTRDTAKSVNVSPCRSR